MTNRVKIEHHIDHLEIKHRALDDQIHKMESNGLYEDEEIHQLKKQRLALKDEIEMNKHRLESL